jgi:hypothetical protein
MTHTSRRFSDDRVRLASDQTRREGTAERVEQLVGDLASTPARFGVARTDETA